MHPAAGRPERPYGRGMKIGLNASDLLVAPDLAQITAAAVAAEVDGFASFWLAQTALLDAQSALALVGHGTSTITLGTAVVPTWSRHPHAMAAEALTTQAASGGRFVLGIGLSHRPVVEDRYKMEWTKPVRHMNEYLDVLLPLLHDGSSDHTGEIFSFVGEGARPTTEPPKVMLAALGEQMLRIAGRRTDGTILWCVGPATIERQIRPIIDGAADEAGRPSPSIVCSLPVWVTADPTPARDFVGAVFSRYGTLPSYRAMLDIEGVDGLADIALVGSHDEVTDGIARIAAAGASDFTAVVMGGNPDEIAAGRAALLAAV
jgi:F420-dependent oxidoreductase-like protein